MDKLEQYLDQVCRGIAGPRAMRQHIRQELREHLRDAIDEHISHGMTEDEALARALEDFGGADQVRSELEATHGHRLLSVAIDKALDWKERTMKAKWVWTTWAHVALFAVILIELFCITATTVLVLPKYQQIMRDIWNSPEVTAPEWNTFVARTTAIFNLLWWFRDNAMWIIVALLIAWVLFEWHVRSENKSYMRLSAFGSIAAVLAVLSVMMFASMILPTVMAVPNMRAERPETLVTYNTQRLDKSIAQIEQAMANSKDWTAAGEPVQTAAGAIADLSHLGGAGPSIASATQRSRVNSIRENLRAADEAMRDARMAWIDRDAARMRAALDRFHQSYDKAVISATTLPATIPSP
jgi:hypothetical protein